MAEARVRALEQALASVPTIRQTETQVKEQMDLYFGLIKNLLDAGGFSAPRNFRTRDAKDHAPTSWSGDKDSIMFSEFMGSVKNRADALHDGGVEMLELVEGSKIPVEEDKLDF